MKTFTSVKKFGNKQAGFVLTSELVLLTTVLVIGMVVGLTTLRDSVNAEMEDISEAIGSLDQSYEYAGLVNDTVAGNITAASAGSSFNDAVDSTAHDGVTLQFTVAGNEAASTQTAGASSIAASATAITAQ